MLRALRSTLEGFAHGLALWLVVGVATSGCGEPLPAQPTCWDGRLGGDEADVDCGGRCGASCAYQQRCGGADDCLSGVCEGGRCAGQPCAGQPCRGRGRCAPEAGTCECDAGWTGATCQTCDGTACADLEPEIILGVTDGTSGEDGGQACVTARLTALPHAVVTLAVDTDDPAEAVAVTSGLVFGLDSWWRDQHVCFSGVDDQLKDADATYRARFRAASEDARYHDQQAEVVLVNTDGRCGNGVVDGFEACDAGEQSDAACPYGSVSCERCGADCTVREVAGRFCGDGVRDPEEACDLSQLGPQDCGIAEPTLRCGPGCQPAWTLGAPLLVRGPGLEAVTMVAGGSDGSATWSATISDGARVANGPPHRVSATAGVAAVVGRHDRAGVVRWASPVGGDSPGRVGGVAACDDGSAWVGALMGPGAVVSPTGDVQQWTEAGTVLIRHAPHGVVRAWSPAPGSVTLAAAANPETCDAWTIESGVGVRAGGDGARAARLTLDGAPGGWAAVTASRAGAALATVYGGAVVADPAGAGTLLPTPDGAGVVVTWLGSDGKPRLSRVLVADALTVQSLAMDDAGRLVLALRHVGALTCSATRCQELGAEAPSALTALDTQDALIWWSPQGQVIGARAVGERVSDVALADDGVTAYVGGSSAQVVEGIGAAAVAWELPLTASQGVSVRSVAVAGGDLIFGGAWSGAWAAGPCPLDDNNSAQGSSDGFVIRLRRRVDACVASAERCDGTDNDCDGVTDEAGSCGAYACEAGLGCPTGCEDNTTCGIGAGCHGGACVAPPNAPDGMVAVDGAPYVMGCGLDDPRCAPDARERPRREITAPAFAIDQTEVTRGAMTAFLATGACDDAGGGCVVAGSVPWAAYVADGVDPAARGLPATWVTWEGARRYCAWRGHRLCTEAQWERAARGTDGRHYPWGDAAPDCQRATLDDGTGAGCGTLEPSPVGARAAGASPVGALDMAGNVREWVLDWFASDAYAADYDAFPVGPMTSPAGHRAVRGGSFADPQSSSALRATARGGMAPDAADELTGFRCCTCPSQGCETCQDGVANGLETDVDCGAIAGCGGCALGAGCQTTADCAEGVCSGGVCAPPEYAWEPLGLITGTVVVSQECDFECDVGAICEESRLGWRAVRAELGGATVRHLPFAYPARGDTVGAQGAEVSLRHTPRGHEIFLRGRCGCPARFDTPIFGVEVEAWECRVVNED